MKQESLVSLCGRYILLLLLPLGNLWLFYTIFTPLTFWLVVLILGQFKELIVSSSIAAFVVDGVRVSLIPACIAGSAYYLLCILNLTTPMLLRKRLQSLMFLLGCFYFLNVARIVIFVFLIDSMYFDVAHTLVWYLGSTLVVVGVWFANTLIFTVKEIPVYTDFKRLWKAHRKK